MEDRAFFFFRSSSAFLLASSSSLRAFSSCGVQHTKQVTLGQAPSFPQQSVSVQGMWSEQYTDENWQLLFSALTLREWSFHLWTEAGRTCSSFVSRDLSSLMQKQGEGSRGTYRKPCLTLLLLLSPDSLLLCSFSSALLLQGAEALDLHPGFTCLHCYTPLPRACFIEWEPPSLFLEHAGGFLVQFPDIKEGAKRGDRWREKPFDLSSHFSTWQHSFLSKSDSGFSFSSTDDLSI